MTLWKFQGRTNNFFIKEFLDFFFLTIYFNLLALFFKLFIFIDLFLFYLCCSSYSRIFFNSLQYTFLNINWVPFITRKSFEVHKLNFRFSVFSIWIPACHFHVSGFPNRQKKMTVVRVYDSRSFPVMRKKLMSISLLCVNTWSPVFSVFKILVLFFS